MIIGLCFGALAGLYSVVMAFKNFSLGTEESAAEKAFSDLKDQASGKSWNSYISDKQETMRLLNRLEQTVPVGFEKTLNAKIDQTKKDLAEAITKERALTQKLRPYILKEQQLEEERQRKEAELRRKRQREEEEAEDARRAAAAAAAALLASQRSSYSSSSSDDYSSSSSSDWGGGGGDSSGGGSSDSW